MLNTDYTIIFDISQLLSANYLGNYDTVVDKELNSIEFFHNMIRQRTLTSLFYHCRNFKIKPNQMILAIDDKQNWRRKYFNEYKATRRMPSKKESSSTLDHRLRYIFYDQIISELESLGFPSIKVANCEADDVIGTISRWHDKSKKCIILSRDHDFLQLISDNVKLYDWYNKEIINEYYLKKDKDLKKCIIWKTETEEDAKSFLRYHILYGDPGDSVPNIYSDNDVFVNPLKKKKPLGPVGIVRKFFTDDVDKNMLAFKEVHHNFTENFERNTLMISLAHVPQALQSEIWNKFINLEEKTLHLEEIRLYLLKHELLEMAQKIDKLF